MIPDLSNDYHCRFHYSPVVGYHCTTDKKLKRYINSGRIIAPVRFWPSIETAQKWCKQTDRQIILKIELTGISYPLPDHKSAMWCPTDVVKFEQIKTYD